jgi:predicted lipoprotein with Yx(FWY)xxD motif
MIGETRAGEESRRAPGRIGRPGGGRRGAVVALAALAAGAASSLGGVVGLSAAQAAGHSAPMVKAANRSSFGVILVTSKGAALYRYSQDHPNTPTCTGACAAAWPPLLLPTGVTTAKGGSGVSGLGTVKLQSGRLQVTYHKMPLYTFASDSGTGVTGNGVGGFFVVKAHAQTSASQTTQTTKPSSGGGYGY